MNKACQCWWRGMNSSPSHSVSCTCHSKLPECWGSVPLPSQMKSTWWWVQPTGPMKLVCSICWQFWMLSKFLYKADSTPPLFFIILLISLSFLPTKSWSLRPHASRILFSITFQQNIFFRYEKNYIHSLKQQAFGIVLSKYCQSLCEI